MVETFGTKLKQMRKQIGLSIEDVAALSEVSSSYWSLLENDKRNVPKPATLKKMAKGLRRPATDLYNIAGIMPELQKLTANNALSAQRVVNQNIMGSGLELVDTSIPVYGMIHAGPSTFADEHIIGTTPISHQLVNDYGADNIFALQIKGDSMSHVLPPDFVAVFVKGIQIKNGDIVAVLINGENATIKRYRETSMAVMFEPDSYNDIYQPIVFPKNGEQNFTILGKYVYASSVLR